MTNSSTGILIPTHGGGITESPTLNLSISTLDGNTKAIRFPIGSPPSLDPSLVETQARFKLHQQKPRFSVVMTHHGLMLKSFWPAINSLVNQSFMDWELVFLSDSAIACRGVSDIAKDLGINVRTKHDIISETRSQRFARAVTMAQGFTVAILDSDDMLHPHALKTVNWCLEKLPEFEYFSTSHQEISSDGTLGIVNLSSAYGNTLAALCEGFRQRHFWGFPNLPKKWIPEMLNSPFIVEDFHIFSNLARRSVPILSIPNVCYYYRRHSMQITVQRKREIESMVEAIMKGNRDSAKFKGPSFALKQMMDAGAITAKVQMMYMPK